MAKEVSVGAEGPRQFKRGRITFVPDLSRQISTLEWCCACRKTFGRNCGRWKLALLTKTRLRHQMAWWKRAVFSCIFYCKDQCEKRKRTVAYHSKICAVRFVDLYGIIKMYSHFLQCIPSRAKMLMGLFFLGWTLMKVARNDIITQISGLVGNLCVGQLCVGRRYH